MLCRRVATLVIFAALAALAGCGAVNVQPSGGVAAAASAPTPRALASTAENRQLRGCLHCAP